MVWDSPTLGANGDAHASVIVDGVVVGKIIYYDLNAEIWEVISGKDLVCEYRGTDEESARAVFRCLVIRSYLLCNGVIKEEQGDTNHHDSNNIGERAA